MTRMPFGQNFLNILDDALLLQSCWLPTPLFKCQRSFAAQVPCLPHLGVVFVPFLGCSSLPVVCSQVLEQVPMTVNLYDWISVLLVPRDGPIGMDERDYSFFQVSVYNAQGVMENPPPVAFFSTGKLGALKGGLANVGVIRKVFFFSKAFLS